MKKLTVKASRQYDILIEGGLLDRLGKIMSSYFQPCRVAVITDDIVAKLYLSQSLSSLENAGFTCFPIEFKNGEGSKNLEVYGYMMERLASLGLDRGDLIVALGGGVTGDMAGFAAATYMRGIRCIQIPTTVLASVDSSVGGKTGLNLSSGKNLAGAFWQPSLVLCDTDTFSSLPSETFSDGVAEIIKYGMIWDKSLLASLAESSVITDDIILRCCSIKADIVNRDEFENGERRLLNFGHTIGHAIEKCSGYKIPHGHAVAAGMAIITRAAVKLGYAPQQVYALLSKALEVNMLPLGTHFSINELAEAALHDKKRSGDSIALIIPVSEGNCTVKAVPVTEISVWLKAGLER